MEWEKERDKNLYIFECHKILHPEKYITFLSQVLLFRIAALVFWSAGVNSPLEISAIALLDLAEGLCIRASVSSSDQVDASGSLFCSVLNISMLPCHPR